MRSGNRSVKDLTGNTDREVGRVRRCGGLHLPKRLGRKLRWGGAVCGGNFPRGPTSATPGVGTSSQYVSSNSCGRLPPTPHSKEQSTNTNHREYLGIKKQQQKNNKSDIARTTLLRADFNLATETTRAPSSFLPGCARPKRQHLEKRQPAPTSILLAQTSMFYQMAA